jgi:hypothetical protein
MTLNLPPSPGLLPGNAAQSEFSEILAVLDGCVSAAVKLCALSRGISIDGFELAGKIEGYPASFKTKRTGKKLSLSKSGFCDAETRETAWIPSELVVQFPDGDSIVKVNFREDSPFRLSVADNGELQLCTPFMDLSFHCRMLLVIPHDLAAGSGYPVEDYLQTLGCDRLGVLGFEGCEAWLSRLPCKFCDSCASRPGEQSAVPQLNDLHSKFNMDIPKWLTAIEADYLDGIRQAAQKRLNPSTWKFPHAYITLLAGNLADLDAEWRYMIRMAASLRSAIPLDGPHAELFLNIMPPQNTDLLFEAREAGITTVAFNIELFGAAEYAATCPHKSSLISYEGFMERLVNARDVFGVGHARCGIVLGIQEPAIIREGAAMLAEQGIAVDFTVFTPKKGTPWQNRQQTDALDVARFAMHLKSLYITHGFCAQYSRLSARSSIMNELLQATETP